MMEKMKIDSMNIEMADAIAPLVADFRVALKALKGLKAIPDIASGKEEILEYLHAGWPCFAAVENGLPIGYMVCRVEEPVVWVESIYVEPAYRRSGVASGLYEKAEAIAQSYGEDTVYNNVHPNNEKMIAFLRKRGYTVLNLIEIRKPWKNETCMQTIPVGNNTFDY